MPVYKLTIEYDGTRYRGWQTQANTGRTIAAALARALAELFEEKIRIHGAGRTDAGVHALAQVAHFRARRSIRPEEIVFGLNDRLPFDINVLSAERAPDGFHARHDALSRTYLYRISRRRSAFEKPFVWWVKDRLDAPAMARAAELFEGRHDFSSFCENPAGQGSTAVVVESCRVTEEDGRILVRIRASHFLWKMVRRIVGTLTQIGRGELSVDDVPRLLGKPSREPATWTAPPSGLFLEKVAYRP